MQSCIYYLAAALFAELVAAIIVVELTVRPNLVAPRVSARPRLTAGKSARRPLAFRRAERRAGAMPPDNDDEGSIPFTVDLPGCCLRPSGTLHARGRPARHSLPFPAFTRPRRLQQLSSPKVIRPPQYRVFDTRYRFPVSARLAGFPRTPGLVPAIETETVRCV